MMKLKTAAIGIVMVCLASPLAAEVIEEIVAVVDGEIITRSEFEEEEQALLAEAYRRFTGAELDRQVEAIRAQVLTQMIDRKVLMHRAARLFDLSGYEQVLLDQFKKDNSIDSDQELERLLAAEGMTVGDVRRRLIEQVAPQEVIRAEVGNRVASSPAEIEEYYEQNKEMFRIKAEYTLREIVIRAGEEDREEKRALAGQILEQARAESADFAALAREHSEAGTAEGGGSLGAIVAGDLSPELEKAAREMQIGSVSDLLEMEYGFHILRLEDRKEAGLQELEEVREKIRIFLENTQYVEKMNAFLKKARDESDIEVRPGYRDRYIQAD
jgi:parvulin-like peptidyl-prolyl isomerase